MAKKQKTKKAGSGKSKKSPSAGIQIDDPVTVEGHVTELDLSGIGPNSGEITLGITQDNGAFVQVFGGIMPDKRDVTGLENGVYASYVSVAVAAFTQKFRVRCTYQAKDKLRMTGLGLLSATAKAPT